MAEAQFTPYLPPGGIVDAAFSGASQMQSLMERGQQMRQSAEQAQRQREIYEVGRPVMEAKAQADLAVAQGTLYNARQIQQLRGQFGMQSKEASAEYEQAMQLPTYKEQAKALSEVAQKYSYFELIPEGKAFIQTVQNMQLQQHNSAILNSKGQQALDRERMMAEGRISVVQAKGDETRATDAAAGKGRSKEVNDIIYASTLDQDNPELADQIRQHAITIAVNKTKTAEAIQLEQEIRKMKADPTSDPAAIARLETRAKTESERAQKRAAFLLMEDAIAEAKAKGDNDLVQRLEAKQVHDTGQDNSTYKRTPGPTPEQPATISWLQRPGAAVDALMGKRPSAAAPIPATKIPAIPKDADTTTIDGKTYPVARDKNGNRAYLKDGHYYPIP